MDTDLEEDGLAVAAGGAADGLGARQRRIGGDVLVEHLRELAGGVVHHVPVHQVAVRHLLHAEFQFQTLEPLITGCSEFLEIKMSRKGDFF